MGRFATGVTVVTTIDRDTIHGMTANAFLSVSLRPPLVLVSLGRCRMNEMLPRTGRYGVSVLAHDQEHFAAHFAAQQRLAGRAPRSPGTNGLPLLEGALAHLVCRVVDVHPAGDHVLWIGEVEHLDHREGEPLLFYTGRFGTAARVARPRRATVAQPSGDPDQAAARAGAPRRRPPAEAPARTSGARSGPSTTSPTSPLARSARSAPPAGAGSRRAAARSRCRARRRAAAVARTASRSSSCGSVAYSRASISVAGYGGSISMLATISLAPTPARSRSPSARRRVDPHRERREHHRPRPGRSPTRAASSSPDVARGSHARRSQRSYAAHCDDRIADCEAVDHLCTNWYKAQPRGSRCREALDRAPSQEEKLATATVEEVQLLKTLRWWDGFVIALCNPGFLLGSLGFTLGVFGVVGVDDPVGLLGDHRDAPGLDLLRAGDDVRQPQRRHLAVRPRGLAPVHARWSARCRRSATGSAGRSCCRSSARSSATWRRRSGGPTRPGRSTIFSNHLGLPHFIAIGDDHRGVAVQHLRAAPGGVVHATHARALLMIPLALFIIVPYFTGDWHSSNVHATFTGPWGGIKIALVYMFILALVGLRHARSCATFAPEYQDTERDTARALRSAAMFMLLVCILVPLGLGGVTGVRSTDGAEGQFYTAAMQQIVGHGAASFFTICIIASLLLSMTSSTADAGRALFGISTRRHDDQAAGRAQPLPRPRPRDDRRPGRERRAGACSSPRTWRSST